MTAFATVRELRNGKNDTTTNIKMSESNSSETKPNMNALEFNATKKSDARILTQEGRSQRSDQELHCSHD